MLSPKEDTQRRMLSNKNISKNPKFASMANIASRSPSNKFENKPTFTTIAKKHNQIKSSQHTKLKSPLKQSDNEHHFATTSSVINKSKSLENGDTYSGDFYHGKFHGKGTYVYSSQKLKYEGSFLMGKPHGQGKLLALDGSLIYEGNWNNGVKSGQGQYFYNEQQNYYGDWVDDRKHGTGTYLFKGGSYQGGWIAGQREGKGSLKNANGTQFKGTFDKDRFVRGLIRYQNGDEYSGNVLNNQRDGQEGAYLQARTNTRYKGQWQADKKHGRGTLFYENGDQLQGTFDRNILNESQVVSYKWRDGSIFSGWLKNNTPHKGTVTKLNGEKWEL